MHVTSIAPTLAEAVGKEGFCNRPLSSLCGGAGRPEGCEESSSGGGKKLLDFAGGKICIKE